MGQNESRGTPRAEGGDAHDAGGASLWTGVPEPVLWLVQAQVRQLISNHSSALLTKPEDLADGTRDDNRQGELQPHEAALAHAALHDRALAPKLQRVLDRLVPAHLSEAAFWDNFFSHVDVLKVRLVTDFLTAQDRAQADRTRKHEEWVRLFDAMEPEMRLDLRRAAERIAARQQPQPLTATEEQLGLNVPRAPRWEPEGEAWLEYVEDGPHEVLKVLRQALKVRGEHELLAASPSSKDHLGVLPLWRSPDNFACPDADAENATGDPQLAGEGPLASHADPPMDTPSRALNFDAEMFEPVVIGGSALAPPDVEDATTTELGMGVLLEARGGAGDEPLVEDRDEVL
mmetsp:Transcript_73332/g.145900  ORF Transcript_73332/g.145900 Transcript_73332/m.145900 type:complete len:345 (-) Transcript_73332:120-1154(-)